MAQNGVTTSSLISSNGTGNAYGNPFFLVRRFGTDIFFSGNSPLSMMTSRTFLAFRALLRDNRLFQNSLLAVFDHIPFQNRELVEPVLIFGNGWGTLSTSWYWTAPDKILHCYMNSNDGVHLVSSLHTNGVSGQEGFELGLVL